jgi:hypothetical protein
MWVNSIPVSNLNLETGDFVFSWDSSVSPIKYQNSNTKETMTPFHIPSNSSLTNHSTL